MGFLAKLPTTSTAPNNRGSIITPDQNPQTGRKKAKATTAASIENTNLIASTKVIPGSVSAPFRTIIESSSHPPKNQRARPEQIIQKIPNMATQGLIQLFVKPAIINSPA